LVEILMVDFDHQNLVSAADSFDETPGMAALPFQTPSVGDMELQTSHSDVDVDIVTHHLEIWEKGLAARA